METRRWTNPSQPQTLQIAVLLLYINAVFGLIYGALGTPLGLILVVGGIVAGFGIANEKRWGYILGIVAAGVDVLLSVGSILSLMFAVALVALLLHPQSRGYQRIWFR